MNSRMHYQVFEISGDEEIPGQAEIKITTDNKLQNERERCSFCLMDHKLLQNHHDHDQETTVPEYGNSDDCHLLSPLFTIENNEELLENTSLTCLSSLPNDLRLGLTEYGAKKKLGIFTTKDISFRTRLGPIKGSSVVVKDFVDGLKTGEEITLHQHENLEQLWFLHHPFTPLVDGDFIVISTEDEKDSNWCRYIDISINLDECNIILVPFEKKLYFMTLKEVITGEKLIAYAPILCYFLNKTNTMLMSPCELCVVDVEFQNEIEYCKHQVLYHYDTHFRPPIKTEIEDEEVIEENSEENDTTGKILINSSI